MRPMKSLAVLGAALILAISSLPAETTRTLKLELPSDVKGAFAVENLVGSMRVSPGSADTVTVIATVHAETAEAADGVQLLKVEGEKGVPTLRIRYPMDQIGTIRYPGDKSDEGVHSFFESLFGGSSTTTKYDGHRVKVSHSSGTLVYADVEIQVPRRDIEATFRNLVGKITGEKLQGKILFDTASGDIFISDSKGEISTDGGSGDVKASDIEGSFKCDTGSGDCLIDGFHGEKIECDVGSGDVTVRSATARLIKTDTGSGDIRVEEGDAEEFIAGTGSGDVDLHAKGTRLTRIKADTGSGDVRLRLDPDATFEAMADQGSGEIVNRFSGAEPIVKDKVVVGYRRGDARIHIDIDTGSGDFVLEPSR